MTEKSGDRIRAFREEWGMSQADLARMLHVQSDRTVRRWEGGDQDIPGPVTTFVDSVTYLRKVAPRTASVLMEHLRTGGV